MECGIAKSGSHNARSGEKSPVRQVKLAEELVAQVEKHCDARFLIVVEDFCGFLLAKSKRDQHLEFTKRQVSSRC